MVSSGVQGVPSQQNQNESSLHKNWTWGKLFQSLPKTVSVQRVNDFNLENSCLSKKALWHPFADASSEQTLDERFPFGEPRVLQKNSCLRYRNDRLNRHARFVVSCKQHAEAHEMCRWRILQDNIWSLIYMWCSLMNTHSCGAHTHKGSQVITRRKKLPWVTFSPLVFGNDSAFLLPFFAQRRFIVSSCQKIG